MQKFKTHGKWILAGEHAVLRGCSALVFPVKSRYLEFSHTPSSENLSVQIDAGGSDLEMAFWGVLEKALQQVGVSRSSVKGSLYLKSNIPVGAGMGASATLCVSLARWFTSQNFIKEQNQYSFAKSLEDLFHGQSSGVDVAVALNHQALEFTKPDKMKPLTPAWEPHLYLSYCGKRGVTSDCISKVQKLIKENPELGMAIDEDMQKAVDKAKESLLRPESIDLLSESMNLAKSCFDRWSLIGDDLKQHMELLDRLGAVATKPTGSGDGGFVISLWRERIEEGSLPVELIEA